MAKGVLIGMLRLSTALFVFALLLALVATPAPAAEQFAGVTERGQIVAVGTNARLYALDLAGSPPGRPRTAPACAANATEPRCGRPPT